MVRRLLDRALVDRLKRSSSGLADVSQPIPWSV